MAAIGSLHKPLEGQQVHGRHAGHGHAEPSEDAGADLEPGLAEHELQQFAVALRRPAQVDHVMHIVPHEVAEERPRHALIE